MYSNVKLYDICPKYEYVLTYAKICNMDLAYIKAYAELCKHTFLNL